MAKKKTKKVAAAQRTSHEVGYKHPPKECQWPPGQSGNPKGAPVHRINLWPLLCRYMNLTDAELEKIDRTRLTQAQQTALKLVEDIKAGKYSGSQRLARHIFDREEGKPVEHIIVGNEQVLTDAECKEVRDILLKNNANR